MKLVTKRVVMKERLCHLSTCWQHQTVKGQCSIRQRKVSVWVEGVGMQLFPINFVPSSLEQTLQSGIFEVMGQ